MTTTTTTTTETSTTPTTRVRTGLVLGILLGLVNVPFLFMPTGDGQDGPPYAVLVLNAVLGIVSIITAVMAWRGGNRVAIRICAATVIINAVTTLPAFFANVSAGIQVVAAVTVLISVLAVVLMLGRPARSTTVVD